MDLIKHLAQTQAVHLHPLGEEGTNLLLKNIQLNQGDRVLEIGCGNGATAEKILQKIKVDYHAVEKSSEMLYNVKKKNNIPENNLSLIQENTLPYENNFFDVIFAESVLAIIEGWGVQKMVSEIYRVLKPKGIFVSNDSIWKPETTKDIILKINSLTKTKFNLIQANDLWCYQQDWIRLFSEIGFKNIETIRLTPRPSKNRMIHRFNQEKWNAMLIKPLGFVHEFQFKYNLKKMYKYGDYIEAFIFKMQK